MRAVVDSFFAAVEREQWDSAAAFVDTTGFGDFVRHAVREARSYVPAPAMTVERIMAQDSTMPRAVAEWYLKRYRQSEAGSAPFPALSYEFSGVDSPQQLADLSTSQALARWIAATDERVAIREMARRAGCPEIVSSSLTYYKSLIRAVAFAGDTTAYVIADRPHVSEGNAMYGAERVLMLHPRAASWRLVPRRDLLNASGMGISGVGCDRK